MNLMELQIRYGQLHEAFSVALVKYKEGILFHLEEIWNLLSEMEQDMSKTTNEIRKERELRITQTVERSSMEREKTHAVISRLVEELEGRRNPRMDTEEVSKATACSEEPFSSSLG